jgi:transposase-like protein
MTTTINQLETEHLQAEEVNSTDPPNPEVPERSKGRRQFSAKYKKKVLADYDALPRSARGAYLRREGLYSSLIVNWRQQLDQQRDDPVAPRAARRSSDPREREIVRLTKEVDRLAGELDKSRRVVEIQSKLSALLEHLATDSSADRSEKK